MKRSQTQRRLTLDDGVDPSILYGSYDAHLRQIERAIGVQISGRGHTLVLSGDADALDRTEAVFSRLVARMHRTGGLTHEAVEAAIAGADPATPPPSPALAGIPRAILPKNAAQSDYVSQIQKHDVVIGIGPAGTGKTYLAMAMAVAAFLRREVSRIILSRPAVEAGERLGFLPGDLSDKVDPYLRPLYDALYEMMGRDRAHQLIERGDIEVAPLAFMRGRTLSDAFIILDEAQNTTPEQIKMFLTRLGPRSKTVITGDVTQIDLPANQRSGLVEIQEILASVPGVKFIHFSDRDVLRHRLVSDIVKAYAKHAEKTAAAKTGKRKKSIR